MGIHGMKYTFLLIALLGFAGCSRQTEFRMDSVNAATLPTRKDDSSACAYWKCSKERKLYMQKYVKNDGTEYYPAGAFKLDQGIGAFPLNDLEKYGSDGSNVSLDSGFDPCPYCRNPTLGRCHCGKTLCTPNMGATVTCPWCDRSCTFNRIESWDVGGGG